MAGKEKLSETKSKSKRHRKRKARTQVSISPESSENESSATTSHLPDSLEESPKDNPSPNTISKSKAPKSKRSKPIKSAGVAEQTEIEPAPSKPELEAKVDSAPGTFESYYLRMVTSEFAEDLDKVRSASDFKDSSLPVLVHALQQGASIFSKEERRRITLAASKGTAE